MLNETGKKKEDYEAFAEQC